MQIEKHFVISDWRVGSAGRIDVLVEKLIPIDFSNMIASRSFQCLRKMVNDVIAVPMAWFVAVLVVAVLFPSLPVFASMSSVILCMCLVIAFFELVHTVLYDMMVVIYARPSIRENDGNWVSFYTAPIMSQSSYRDRLNFFNRFCVSEEEQGERLRSTMDDLRVLAAFDEARLITPANIRMTPSTGSDAVISGAKLCIGAFPVGVSVDDITDSVMKEMITRLGLQVPAPHFYIDPSMTKTVLHAEGTGAAVPSST